MRISFTIALLLFAVTAWAQKSEIGVEIGYQDHEVDGNEELYRAHADEDSGFLLHHFHWNFANTENPDALLQRLDLNVSGFGALPHGRLRLRASNNRLYSLRLDYQRHSLFNALPAAELAGESTALQLGRHVMDRTRDTADFEIRFRPGTAFQPIFGVRWSSYSGPADTTYHLGEDEFLIHTDLDESELSYHLGFAYKLGKFEGELIQGWRDFEGDEHAAVLEGLGNDGTVLGQDIVLDSLNRDAHYEADTPVTTLTTRAMLSPRLKLAGAFIHADAESDWQENESVSGNFVNFQIHRVFGQRNQSVRAQTESPSWNGRFRVDAELVHGIDATLGVNASHRELDGNALVDMLYLDATLFGSEEAGTFTSVLDADTHLERDQTLIEGKISVARIENFVFWAGFATEDQEIRVDQALAQIIVPGGQEGDFDRQVDQLNFGATFKRKGLRATLSYELDDADQAVTRTDFIDRTTLKFQLRAPLGKSFSLGARWQETEMENDNPALGYDAERITGGLDLNYAHKHFHAMVGWDVYDYDSRITYLRPENFTTDFSLHAEDGDRLLAQFGFEGKHLLFSGHYSSYENEGLVPFTLDTTSLEAGYGIGDNFHLILQLHRQEYEEDLLPLANYEADSVALLFRWQQ